jgi:uncharacterized DUF497 family protein
MSPQQKSDRFFLMNQDTCLLKRVGIYRGKHLYLALGTTDSGRYLAVYFLYKKNKEALIVTARDMTENETKRYAKK